MGARGPAPKDNLASMAGVLEPLRQKAPDGIRGGSSAKKEYERLAAQLSKLGHLTDLNRQALVNYCEARELADMALDELHALGVTLENAESGNRYMNPAMTALSMSLATMEREAKALGMTPAALQSIKNVKPQKSEKKEGGPSAFLT
ncbi:phage terminase small subunit P27 family [Luteolibacter sp. GHJ8]|uniref:Phage terminase small subunit P27 family n=1 Tax=Luteolibacter rhizosphaerae TaxID=2989719 RepID=A0ABT3G9X9_9BACT|nr:phage terminase small subunit P27 family [Luteolibacter rhizosphaerae]MCW1916605.1 phage terminase small subunit P27 family [Luteolibacter rhizosphaerae]